MDSLIEKSFIFDGIVYYGNTHIKISLKRKRTLRKPQVVATGSFRLLNCIYKKWMEERQGKQGDQYAALTEQTEFTPVVSFLTKEQAIAYTLPFQRLTYFPLLPHHEHSSLSKRPNPHSHSHHKHTFHSLLSSQTLRHSSSPHAHGSHH